jgi:hypothetical protein
VRRRARRNARVAYPVAMLLGLTTACGSTVDLATSPGQAPAGTGSRLPGSPHLPVGTGPETLSTTDGAPAVLTPAAGSPSTATAAPVGGRSGSGVAPPSGIDGPGVTPSTITFGVTYTLDAGQANAAIGAAGTDPGDVRDYYNALVDEVNRSGGIAGRRLVSAYYETQSTSAESADSQRQAACEYFSHDVKAFVFFEAVSEVARGCAEKRRMVSLSGGGNAIHQTFRRHPHYLEPSGVALETYEGATVSGLARTDYYGKAPVIGIVTWDDPSFRTAVSRGMLPELVKLGLKPRIVEYVYVPQSYADAGTTSASVGSAVLKFREAGVTHAFVIDGPAGAALGTVLTLAWIRAAGSQAYYPRYGFNDLNSPQAGLDAHLWEPNDVRGARYVTANNATDATDVGVAKNQSRIACLAVMRRHGMIPGNMNAQGFMLRACDNVFFLRAVLGTTRITVNRDRFVALAEALGKTYRSPTSYRTVLSPSRHYGVAGYRRMAMDDSCGCFRYISGIYAG